MKRTGRIFAVFAILSLLCSCSQSEFINLSVFIENYNAYSENTKLDFPDFTVSTGSAGETVYTCIIKEQEEEVLLRLISDEDGKISQCRIVVPKCDETGNKLSQSETRHKFFVSAAQRVICAYTFLSKEESQKISDEFGLSLSKTLINEGELTKTQGSFHFVYLSNARCSEFVIYNKWLHEIESTQKPESKSAYADSTNVRTETVAHS